MQSVRIGFVGTGGIANHHLRQLAEIEEAQIVALCDVSEDSVRATAETYGGAVYTDHKKMLDEAEMDALFVCIPPFAHTDAEILAAERGIHLFVEKPVALTMDKGIEVNEAIQKAGVLSCVGYSVRYTAGAAVGKKFLEDRTIAMVACDRWGGVPGGADHWWRVMDKSGGQLVEMTTHQVDMIRYLVGEVKEVYARYALRTLQNLENLTVPDVQVIALEFKNGAVGYVTCSCALINGGGLGRMEFILDGMRMSWDAGGIQVSPGNAAPIPEAPADILSIDQSFVKAVATGDASLIKTPYDDGLRSLDVTLAANQSAIEGRPIKPVLSA